MAFDGDPYRTLGLPRGATLDEVKRAYRRLAKVNHPDAGGSAALSRFLAIQAAYEQLVDGRSAPGAKPRSQSNASRRASEADRDRADATRRAYGGRPRARRPAGPPPGPARPGAGQADAQSGDAAQADPQSGRRRGKATLGSTSYDDANPGAFEPDWSGANWYGTTSGTYWTINPKEYADPRKHGPEYQARARRAAGARPGSVPEDGVDEAAGGQPDPASETAAGSAHETPSWWQATSDPSGPDDRPGSGAGPGAWHQFDDAPQSPDAEVPDPARALANLARALTDPRSGGVRGRVIRAFVGWVPIAFGIGWILGEITGCGRFAATCDPAVDPLILLIQGATLVALLLAPVLASLAGSAALGLLAAAVAATLVLSATGTAADEASRRATLGLLLVIAWLAGLAIAVAQRLRAGPSRVRPVS